MSELYTILGRMPTDVEIADKIGVTTERYQEDLVNTALCNIISLEALFESREQGDTGINFPSCESNTQPEQCLQEKELYEKLISGMQSLRENEQLVLSLYYEKELNMREIAQVMSISEPRVSQIHSKAIQKLRAYLERYMKSER